mmetsp:Transcript_13238/g.30566  ORF Transcript_13238/g.30566 Transcript_13238/m.30566 type:complete len:128 (+) Transcript_13238:128-511(+)
MGIFQKHHSILSKLFVGFCLLQSIDDNVSQGIHNGNNHRDTPSQDPNRTDQHDNICHPKEKIREASDCWIYQQLQEQAREYPSPEKELGAQLTSDQINFAGEKLYIHIEKTCDRYHDMNLIDDEIPR